MNAMKVIKNLFQNIIMFLSTLIGILYIVIDIFFGGMPTDALILLPYSVILIMLCMMWIELKELKNAGKTSG